MSSTVEVYKGVWKDHANGVWTLTLSERSGGILSAALIIFAGFAAVQAWNIVKFVLHQALSSQSPQDGYRHNLRAVLRNSNSHTQALWLFARLSVGWRKKLGLSRALFRGSLLTTLALTFVVASAIIRLYIPLIWTANGNQVLIQNTQCGYVSIGPENITYWSVYWADRMESATTYVRQCYSEANSASICNRQPAAQLNWTSGDADCPFTDPELCVNTTVPFVMDSGYINTNRDLGMNSKDGDAIDYRKVVTCSPMASNYAEIAYRNSTDENVLEYYYGSLDDNTTVTLSYPENALRYINGYTLTSLGFDPLGTANQWYPNATILDRTDAAASIFFLSANWMSYLWPVSDRWFENEPSDWGDDLDPPQTIYLQVRPVSVLGCIEQHQLCQAATDGNDRHCTPMLSSRGIPSAALKLGMSDRQTATAVRLIFAAVATQLDYGFVARMMPGDQLLASKTQIDTTQYGKLPSNQWRLELSRWFSISLALIQEGVVEYVTGPSDASMEQFVVEQTDANALADCTEQRIRASSGYTNFHLPAVIVVIVIGCCISFVGLFIDTFVGLIQSFFHIWEYGRLQWLLDGSFQQQRLVYEAVGVGSWGDVNTYVPVTDESKFPLIDGLDRDHPRLHHSNNGREGEVTLMDRGPPKA
ncbi:Cytochrome P450 [Botryosphaeria dothidea]|uniref:Cytochrome P450 n=1 Tax=Botryosphaeria dothidea TaxID=55169 RepID=A0A8H4N577_9PEZI|nr:Cytochrome P450 [Botryosphaeria dothidea]